MTRAAIYVRISRDKQGLRAGVERQLADCQSLCAARGWDVVSVREDNSVSAFKGRPRPAYEALLADVRADRVEAVVVWHQDRLWRSVIDQQTFWVSTAGSALKVVATCTGGDFDAGNPDDEFMSTMMAAMAAKESADKGRRVRRELASKAAKGQWAGGPVPAGYRQRTTVEVDPHTGRPVLDADGRPKIVKLVGIELDPDTAPALGAAIRAVADGASISSTVLRLNLAGVTTSGGRPWGRAHFARWASSPHVAGLSRTMVPAEWPALVDVETWERLRRRLRANVNPNPSGSSARKHLLTGLLLCGVCGVPLVPAPVGHRLRYRCPARSRGGCGAITVTAVPADEAVTAMVWARYDDPAFAAELERARRRAASDETELAAIEAQLAADRQRLDALADDFADGTLDKLQYRRQRDRFEARIAEGEARLSRVAPDVPVAVAGTGRQLEEAWPEMSLGERREMIRLVATGFRVARAGRGAKPVAAERITPMWRTWD